MKLNYSNRITAIIIALLFLIPFVNAVSYEFNVNQNTNEITNMTEIDYTLLTAKKLEPNFGLIQVQIPQRRVVACDNCQKEMELEEGTVIYDKKWFHDSCWQSITRGDTIVK